MKIGPILDVRETDDRREKFKNNVASGKWFACVASADLGYFIPITKQGGSYWHSLPIEFRRLGIRRAHKKSFFDARREAEHRIVEAASVCGDSVPMLVFFDPKEKKRVARRGNRLARSPITQRHETAQINPKLLCRNRKWLFSPAFHWLRQIPEISATEILLYGELAFRSDEDGIFRGSLTDIAKEMNFIGPDLVVRRSFWNAINSMKNRFLIQCPQGQRKKKEISFPAHPAMPKSAALNAADLMSAAAENAADLPPEKKNNNREEAAAIIEAELSDKEWLVKIVQSKYPAWSLPDLQLEWKRHGAKAEAKGRWGKGDRGHFLKAWMPLARNPRAGKGPAGATAVEPPYWKDFIDECYPDAPKMTYAQIAVRLPDVVAEGVRWVGRKTRSEMGI